MTTRYGPDSRAAQLLAALKQRPDTVVGIGALEAATGIPSKFITVALKTPAEKAKPGTEWEHVRQAGRGLWVYDSTPKPNGAGTWTEMAPASDGGFVLRGPDGAVYLARRL